MGFSMEKIYISECCGGDSFNDEDLKIIGDRRYGTCGDCMTVGLFVEEDDDEFPEGYEDEDENES